MKRTGSMLAAVLVIIALAAMVAGSLLYRMGAESAATAATRVVGQADEAAMCGIRHAIAVLEAHANDVTVWQDNEELFRDQFAFEAGGDTWYFTLYAYDGEDGAAVRYGLTDEAGRININTAAEDTLRRLVESAPTIPVEEADAIAEALIEYRQASPLASVEELLLVEGVSGEHVYGEDANLNGLLDPNEQDGGERFPWDNNDTALDPGLLDLATVMSYDWDVTDDGRERVNINADLDALSDVQGLPGGTASFIRQYRNDGGVFKHPSELLNMEHRLRRGRNRGRTIRSGVTGRELPVVLEQLTVLSPAGRPRLLPGLVNVNTAAPAVLATLPGVDDDLAARIVEARRDLDAEALSTAAWLYGEDGPGPLDADEFKKIMPRLTWRGRQFRVRCVGFGASSGRYVVLEAIIDLAGSAPRVAYLRDLTRLGLPVPIDPEQLGYAGP